MLAQLILQYLLAAIIGAIVIGAAIFVWKVANARSQVIRQNAEKMALTYWRGSASPRYDDSILLGQQKAGIQDALVTNDGIEMGTASFMTHGGQRSIAFDFIQVTLSRESGMYLLIDSRRNNILARSLIDAGLENSRPSLQKFILEGDFPQNYKVYGIAGSQIAVLALLNPKAMLELIEQFLSYDIEITSNHVYLYSTMRSDSFQTEASIKQRLEEGRRMREFIEQHLPHNKI